MMQHETKTEIIVLSGLAAVMLLVLLMRRAPNGSVLDQFQPFQPVQPATSGGVTQWNVPVAQPGQFDFFTYGTPPVAPAKVSFFDAGNPASCSCSGTQAGSVFGSADYLAQYLASTGQLDASYNALTTGSY
jgi:hypothetical protein